MLDHFEKEEINELRQVIDDAALRAERAWNLAQNDDLAHVIKALVNVKIRLTILAEGRLKVGKSDNGAWP